MWFSFLGEKMLWMKKGGSMASNFTGWPDPTPSLGKSRWAVRPRPRASWVKGSLGCKPALPIVRVHLVSHAGQCQEQTLSGPQSTTTLPGAHGLPSCLHLAFRNCMWPPTFPPSFHTQKATAELPVSGDSEVLLAGVCHQSGSDKLIKILYSSGHFLNPQSVNLNLNRKYKYALTFFFPSGKQLFFSWALFTENIYKQRQSINSENSHCLDYSFTISSQRTNSFNSFLEILVKCYNLK